jgi:hypothetical protein
MKENKWEQPQEDFEIELSDLDEGNAAPGSSFSSPTRKPRFSLRQRRLCLILLNSFLLLAIVFMLGNTTSVRILVSTILVRSIPTSLGSPQTSSPTISPHPTLGALACHPSSPLDTSNVGVPEAEGTTPKLDLWALFLGGIPTTRTDNKIVWRIDTSLQGPPQVVGFGPHEQHLLPLSLQEHGGSNWNRPGSEWGTVFNFPATGCWDLHVTGGTMVGDIWIVVL